MRRKKRPEKNHFAVLMGILVLLAVVLSIRGFDLLQGGFTAPFQNLQATEQTVATALLSVAVIVIALIAVFLTAIYLAYRWFS